MAKIDSKGMVTGTAGSVVYRKYRGMNIIQGKPRKFKQTENSVRASTEFGLSSSTAAVIRRAFEEAYVYRDGNAVSRSTQQVYRSIRNSSTAPVGKRDLHDADISMLQGMEFNNNSKLSDLISQNVSTCEAYEGGMQVKINLTTAMSTLKNPLEIKQSANLYRIRLTLIGFNFRKEYYEYLGVKDIDLRSREILQEQVVKFDYGQRPELLTMMSMTLLAYKETGMKDGMVLLNSKEYSPCAIIATFPAENPGCYPDGPVHQDFKADANKKDLSLFPMGYDGNRLLRKLAERLKKCKKAIKVKETQPGPRHGMTVGRRVSFA